MSLMSMEKLQIGYKAENTFYENNRKWQVQFFVYIIKDELFTFVEKKDFISVYTSCRYN